MSQNQTQIEAARQIAADYMDQQHHKFSPQSQPQKFRAKYPTYHQEYYKKNREKYKQYNKAYYTKHREQLKRKARLRQHWRRIFDRDSGIVEVSDTDTETESESEKTKQPTINP
jgi:hypothetical protein